MPPTRRSRRLRQSAAILFVLLALGGGYCLYVQWSKDAAESAAIRLAEKGPPDEAISALDRCLARDPENPRLLRAMVQAMKRAETHLPDMEPYTARWCRADAKNVSAWRQRLLVTESLERLSEAADAAEHVVALDPYDLETHNKLGRLYVGLGRMEDARRQCLLLLEISPPPHTPLVLSLGQIELARGNLNEAARHLDEVLNEAPEHPDALLSRGAVYAELGDHAKAAEVFRRIKPRSLDGRATALHHLGQSLTRAGQLDEAKKVFDELTRVQSAGLLVQAAEHKPDDMQIQERAGRALLAADAPADAVNLLNAAAGRRGADGRIYLALADCYDRLNRPELAQPARAKAAALSATATPGDR
ncbi:MAG TPA: tetratricopeptide repeat protein [Gemmataceae bacterium]|nr:tetratricopeptide repeat protein [Gemmataceae bacterium]